jgi:hypothetical protein
MAVLPGMWEEVVGLIPLDLPTYKGIKNIFG